MIIPAVPHDRLLSSIFQDNTVPLALARHPELGLLYEILCP